MQKIAQVTAIFWIMKICATTLGETAGDLLSQTLNVGYAISSMILFSIFLISLIFQLLSKKYHPFLYWTVILTTSTAGTTMSDYMDRSLGLGYATGSFILICILLAIFSFWYFSERSLNVNNITTRKVEVIYWIAILFSNTLGTALGDFLADSSGLGFVGGAVLIGSLLGIILLLTYFTNFSRVFLFWIAFVLTRPFGATFGDFLTKSHAKGGLDLGTMGSSLVLVTILIALIIYITLNASKMKESPELNAS
ncbi:COG4705 family protein [Paenibacillus sp. 1-18]|uniref:COG4705 family protein n=1 Tax=Paenibacillus sp. 1-18 TaxID=1333846 RepID=UPI000471F0CB|nr:membrane protein [Paenibacillus sp. 1-18]